MLVLSNANKIDCAVYDITIPWFYPLLQTKKARVITDNENYDKNYSFVKTDSSKNYMHNKFCILDSNILLVGSTNLTQDAFEKQNNNLIITNDKTFVEKFQKYFEELWNGNFTKGFQYNDVCFSPNNCIDLYIEETKKAKKNIKCMFFSFTYDDLSNEILKKHREGLTINIILEKNQDSKYSQYSKLKEKGVNVILDKNPSNMHNKFCIFDNNTVITGSMNPSNNGNFNNNESIIVLQNEKIAQRYSAYFDKYFAMWAN